MLQPSGKCQSVKITIRYFLLLWYRCMIIKNHLIKVCITDSINSTASYKIYYISTCFGPHLQIAIPYSIVMLEVVIVSCITCFAISTDQQYYTSVVFYWDWFSWWILFFATRIRFTVIIWLRHSLNKGIEAFHSTSLLVLVCSVGYDYYCRHLTGGTAKINHFCMRLHNKAIFS